MESAEYFQDVLKTLDKDGDSEMSLEEFLDAMEKAYAAQAAQQAQQ